MLHINNRGELIALPVIQRGELLYSTKYWDKAVEKSISVQFCRSNATTLEDRLGIILVSR